MWDHVLLDPVVGSVELAFVVDAVELTSVFCHKSNGDELDGLAILNEFGVEKVTHGSPANGDVDVFSEGG
jgi:hypothetical protein